MKQRRFRFSEQAGWKGMGLANFARRLVTDPEAPGKHPSHRQGRTSQERGSAPQCQITLNLLERQITVQLDGESECQETGTQINRERFSDDILTRVFTCTVLVCFTLAACTGLSHPGVGARRCNQVHCVIQCICLTKFISHL